MSDGWGGRRWVMGQDEDRMRTGSGTVSKASRADCHSVLQDDEMMVTIIHLDAAMTSLQLFFLASGIMVWLPGCQLAGQTSPLRSVYWKAFTILRYSSGFLPTGKSLIEACLTIPLTSIMQVALKATPLSFSSSHRQPKDLAISLLRSEMRGMSMGPRPPSFLDLRVYSMCENLESTEQASSSQPISLNSLALLLKAMISVGQTKVKSRGQKKRQTYLPLQELRSTLTKSLLYQASATKTGAGFLMSDISNFYYNQSRYASIQILPPGILVTAQTTETDIIFEPVYRLVLVSWGTKLKSLHSTILPQFLTLLRKEGHAVLYNEVMNNISEQPEEDCFFLLEDIPSSLQPKLVPILQLLNLETIDIPALKTLIRGGLPEQSARIREYVWKLVLGFLPNQRKKWHSHVQKQQQTYQLFLDQYLNQSLNQQKHKMPEEGHPDWRCQSPDYSLWEQIEKDTCRTHAQLSFFSEPADSFAVPFYTITRREKYKLISGDEKLQRLSPDEKRQAYNYDHMTRILFIFARLNPKAAYVQGMNQILAPIFYLVNSGHRGHIQEAACFFMFNNVMSDILSMHIKDFGNKLENPIYSRIQCVNTMLLAIQPETWHKLEQLQIDPFFYSFRWITLLFSQEFQMFETLKIWESIFSHEDRSSYTNFIALSLLLASSTAITAGDYSQIMSHLKSLGQNVNIEQIMTQACTLYEQHAQTNFCQLAQKNRAGLKQPKPVKRFDFWRGLF